MKKIDLTNLTYVGLMIIVFLLGSCGTSKEIVPAPKYQPSHCCKKDTTCSIDTWNGLTLKNYESHGNFNYLEDAIEVFGKEIK